MGAGHAHALYVHGHSRVHRMAPEAKAAAAFAFVLAVAVTPPEAIWAFGAHAGILAVVVRLSQLRLRFVLARIVIILPFIAFAFFIPFIASGEQVTVLGMQVSRDGLYGAFNVVAKAGLGVTVSVVLAGTTEAQALLTGLTRLRVPDALTAIAAFMLRYLQVLIGELGRMRVAMTARGYDPRWLWQVRPIANSAGALFIRSFERGERVHAAMLSRGFDGRMPAIDGRVASRSEWMAAAIPPVIAAVVATVALVAI